MPFHLFFNAWAAFSIPSTAWRPWSFTASIVSFISISGMMNLSSSRALFSIPSATCCVWMAASAAACSTRSCMMAKRSASMRRKTEEVKDVSASARSAERKVLVSKASSSWLGAVWVDNVGVQWNPKIYEINFYLPWSLSFVAPSLTESTIVVVSLIWWIGSDEGFICDNWK